MSEPSRNLTPLRGPSVWERTEQSRRREEHLARWVLGASGTVLLAMAFARRTRARATLSLAGAALLGLGASARGTHAALEYAGRRRMHRARRDRVTTDSALSFPASDSPSWSPTTGSVGGGGRD